MIQEDRCSEEKCTTETSDLRLCECCGIHHGVLMYLDWAINILILCPLNVMYWRGLWGLLDIFVVPTHMDISAYISVGLGYAVGFFCYAIQGPLSRYMTDSKKGYFGRFAISRCYTVLFSFGLINEWRGVWQTLDHHFGKSWKSGLTSASVGALVLASTCTLRNILAPPLVMATDHLDDVYASAPTMFNMMKVSVR